MNTINATLTWQGGMAYKVDLRGHEFIMDAAADKGGENKGPRPKPLVLAAVGGCIGITLKTMLDKIGMGFTFFCADIEGSLTKEHPVYYNEIHLNLYISEPNNKPKLLELLDMAHEKYCPICIMIRDVVKITTDVFLLQSPTIPEALPQNTLEKHYVRVMYEKDLEFIAEVEGHKLILDYNEAFGGHDNGPSPRDILLPAYAGCTGMDIVYILKKMRQEVKEIKINIEADANDKPPRVFTNIRLHFIIKGNNLKEEKVKEAIELSQGKYCGVAPMLRAFCKLDYTYEIG